MPLVYDQIIFLLIFALLFALWSQVRIMKTYEKYMKINSLSGYSGAQIAKKILQQNGIFDVQVEPVAGKLSDHYDALSKTVKLSRENYQSHSLAAIMIAAHEVGHVLQHKNAYSPFLIKSSIVSFSNTLSYAIFAFFSIGLLMNSLLFLKFGILFFSTLVLFYLMVLPIELNANSRALRFLKSNGYLTKKELISGKKVLNAATLTYVAASAIMLLKLIKLIIKNNRIKNNSDEQEDIKNE